MTQKPPQGPGVFSNAWRVTTRSAGSMPSRWRSDVCPGSGRPSCSSSATQVWLSAALWRYWFSVVVLEVLRPRTGPAAGAGLDGLMKHGERCGRPLAWGPKAHEGRVLPGLPDVPELPVRRAVVGETSRDCGHAGNSGLGLGSTVPDLDQAAVRGLVALPSVAVHAVQYTADESAA